MLPSTQTPKRVGPQFKKKTSVTLDMAARYGSIVWASVALIDYVVWQRFGIINVAAKTGNHQINSQPVILRFFRTNLAFFWASDIQKLRAAGFVEF